MKLATLLMVTLALSTAALPAQADQARNAFLDELRRENLEKDAEIKAQTKGDRFEKFERLRRENLEKSVSPDDLRRGQLERGTVDFDELRRENLEKMLYTQE